MLRKIMLTGAVLLVPESYEQGRVLVALILSITFLILQLVIKPFKSAADDHLATLVHLALVLLYLCILLIKSCSLSRATCAAYGLGDTGRGVYFFFVFFGMSLLLLLLLVMATRFRTRVGIRVWHTSRPNPLV